MDDKRPAYNERFGATAAVTPQKRLCVIERLSPATKVVEAAAAPSRHPVVCHFGGDSAILKKRKQNLQKIFFLGKKLYLCKKLN